jgi:hypothetical protein
MQRKKLHVAGANLVVCFRSESGRLSCRQVARIVADYDVSLFRFNARDRCPDHDDGFRRGYDHSRDDGAGGDDSATRDVPRHRRPLSLQD